ncbi:alpha/beta hydrolase [Rhodococcus sp. ACPA4]|uniref:alpha/beta fold hydrolase n=1 Tax=unclassified Rhodococcus (in: high G+C Gram-positive bacteria) TaxID=192944 RepID=UPI000BB11BB1|nr:alpha/beta hydrolase [Rhodococcus sp. ACPA4]NRI69653.1 alpha/beta hydrolase [Rhodococcus sp. MS16]PBC44108.1 alpha/beta hydrolase [Rhodococcus sp. ACPA4]
MSAPDPSTVRFDGPWIHRDIHANGIRFHVVEVGDADPDAPLVVLLHGFADIWWSWRHQLTALSTQGFRVVAIDLRGYGDSDKPPRGYDGWTLAGDVAGLIRAMGYGKATLIGHADGGLVCWATAILHPRLVRSIALVSSPHPHALKQSVLRDRYQRKALFPSFLANQLPFRPERKLIADNGAEVERLVRSRSGPAWPEQAEFGDVVSKLRSAIRIPGVAHSTLEYQRWAFRSQLRTEGRRFMRLMDQTLHIPILQIHGELDPYILTRTIRRGRRWAPGEQLHPVSGVGHYAHWEAPQRVNDALRDFLAAD